MTDNTEKRIPYKMLSINELHETAMERVHLIDQEFTSGFKFLENYPKSVTIFGGSHFTEDSRYYQEARALAGRIVTDLKYSVFTGGGPGIMEAANRGAFEAGGPSLGLTIDLAHQQTHNKYLTHNLDFYYFFSRKVCLAFSAEAYVFFPGGFGTLDEFFEIITLVQTGKTEKVPIILFGADFWTPLHTLMKTELLGRATIEDGDLNLYTITDDISQAIEIIRNAPIRNGIKFLHEHFTTVME